SFVLAQLAGIVTLLCINALTRGGGSAEGWVLGLLALVGVTHLVGVLLLHAGFFRDILALDPQRERPEPDLAVVERAFGRVVNAPRYWFLRANFWFVIAAFNLSLARHWVDPDAFPWIHVIVRTTGATAGAFLFGALLFFLLKREFAPMRSALGAALGDTERAGRLIVPVPLRSKILVGVTGALVVATLYGAVLAKVRSERTAEATAVGFGQRLITEVASGASVAEVREQAEHLGLAEAVFVIDVARDPELERLDDWLAPFEVASIRDSEAIEGDSLEIESAHHFAWRRLVDGRVAVTVAPAALFAGFVPSMTGALGVFLGVVLLVTIAVAWLLAADIERAVRRLSEEVGRLASGDLRLGEPQFWEDELGQLSAQVDHMTGSLGAMIVGVRATADRVESSAAGIRAVSTRLLTTSEEQVHGNAALRESILGVTGQAQGIHESAGELTASVEEGSSSILQLRGAGDQLDENASLLSEKVDEVSSSVDELIHSVRDVLEHTEGLSGAAVDTSSSMEQMAASLREVDTNATETARLSNDVVDRAEDGRQKVHETLKGMERIRETTQAAQSVIHGLGGRAKEIGAIVNVIDDVAEETNLLALNAAIIAAQAGENGRSFSVVADEIKKLADRVLSSTKEIEQVITAVQDETSNAIQAIEEGSRVVELGVKRADEAGGALDVITTAARDSGGRIAEIVTAVTEQTKAAGHVVGLMERVRAGVDHIRHAAQEQDRGNESMLASTEVMREIASRVHATTSEQAQGSGRIAEGVAAVSTAVERINASLSSQSGACEAAEAELDSTEERTRAHRALAEELDGSVGRMRESADELREAVERFRV
ncbi:MAG: hypothetical protein JRG83_20185, partial [Deltaproteobacteria bacterium]|nr:hypothetical protein [Deltaproteobacteria bacterium]